MSGLFAALIFWIIYFRYSEDTSSYCIESNIYLNYLAEVTFSAKI